MSKIINLNIKEERLAIFILTTGITLNYVFDALNKVLLLYLPSFSRTGILYRILLQLFALVMTIIFLNKKRFYWLLFFLYFMISFFIANSFLKYYTRIEISILEQFIYFNKYFFILFIFFAVYKVLKKRSFLNLFIKNFKRIFFFNGCLAILGLLFKIKLFYMVPLGTPRFGYTGLIKAANEASIFYLLGLFILYFNWRFKKKSTYILLFGIFICLLTGLKAVYLGILLLFFYDFFSRVNFLKFIKISAIISILIAVVISYSNKLQILFGYYYHFLKEKGFNYMFTGGRNTFIESRIEPLLKEKWNIVNYIFGGQNISNPNDYLSLVEMDFIDVFLFFGIVNGVLFLFIYTKCIVGKIQNRYYLFCIFILGLLAFFAGHFFTSGINPIYVIVVFSYLNANLYELDKKI